MTRGFRVLLLLTCVKLCWHFPLLCPLPLIGGGIKRTFCLTSVCRLSVA